MEQAKAVSQFQKLNRTRIERFRSMMPIQNQFFLEALPLFFQINSDSLPGYISNDTPAGIVDYQPSDTTLDAAKKLSHSFQYKRRGLHHFSIRGLYFVNNRDGFSYHNDSEFELWLIYASPLSEDQLSLLQRKTITICKWASSQLNMSITPRLLDDSTLENNTLSAITRDQFYHSSFHLAGCTPSWWSTPSRNNNQASTINTEQHYNKDDLAFGSLPQLEKGLLAQQAIEVLYRSMAEGFEAGLDLVYINTILENIDSFTWLSEQLKTKLYNDITDPTLLDSNTLKLDFITELAGNNELSLAQQSFYIACKEHLSKTVKQAAYPWRRNFIEQQLDSWRWSDNTSQILDQRVDSHYRQSLQESELLEKQISSTMRTLFSFIKQHQIDIGEQQHKLESVYKQVFKADIDVIPHLANTFVPKASEEQLYLARSNQNEGWTIDDRPPHLAIEPLYRHVSLLNVLVWAINNQLLSKSTSLKVADQTHQASLGLVLDLVQQLLHSSVANKAPRIEPNQSGPQIIKTLLFANIEHEIIDTLGQQGIGLSSLQADPLNYANNRQNLIASIEGLIYSDSGQWHYFIHTGPTAILEMLSTVIQWRPKVNSTLKTACWCPSDSHGKKISDRIESIYTEVITHYNSYPSSGDYLIAIAEIFYRLQWQDNLCDVIPQVKGKSLLQLLSLDKKGFSASLIDTKQDKKALLNTMLKYQQEKQISLFLLPQKQHTILYIIDEFGSVFKQQFTGLTESTLSSHFHAFVSSADINSTITKTALYRLYYSEGLGWKTAKIVLNKNAEKSTYLPVSIEMSSLDKNAFCTIHCGPKTFTGLANDPALFNQVRDLVLSLRNSNNNYPLYISHLSFSEQKSNASRHYIIQKQRLEYLLNQD